MTVSFVSCVLSLVNVLCLLSHVSRLLPRVARDVSHVEATLLLRGLHVQVCPGVGTVLPVIIVPAAAALIVTASGLQPPLTWVCAP